MVIKLRNARRIPLAIITIAVVYCALSLKPNCFQLSFIS
nr:MAG TPA: hypothetical protein [Caudoviricetes sp.]